MNTCKNLHMPSIWGWCKYLFMEWLDHIIDVGFISRETARLFSKVVIPFYIPSSNNSSLL